MRRGNESGKGTTSHGDGNLHGHTGCGRAKNSFSTTLNSTNFAHFARISLDMAQKPHKLWRKVGKSGEQGQDVGRLRGQWSFWAS